MTAIARVTAMFAICGAVAGFTSSLFVPRQYQAGAKLVFVRPYDSDAQNLFSRASETTLLPESMELIVRRSTYYKERLYVDRIATVIEDMRTKLNLRSASVAGTPGATVDFEDDEADAALDITKIVLSEFGNNAARAANAKSAADVIRIVKLPETRLVGLTPWLLTGVGMAAGLLASFVVWLLLPREQATP